MGKMYLQIHIISKIINNGITLIHKDSNIDNNNNNNMGHLG